MQLTLVQVCPTTLENSDYFTQFAYKFDFSVCSLQLAPSIFKQPLICCSISTIFGDQFSSQCRVDGILFGALRLMPSQYFTNHSTTIYLLVFRFRHQSSFKCLRDHSEEILLTNRTHGLYISNFGTLLKWIWSRSRLICSQLGYSNHFFFLLTSLRIDLSFRLSYLGTVRCFQDQHDGLIQPSIAA